MKEVKETSESLNLKGLKRHTRKEREEAAGLVLEILKRDLKENLLALAAQGSFARDEDGDFSDLEMIIFIKEKTSGLPDGFSRVIDGLLIEGIYMTKEEYLEKTLQVQPLWYISGSDMLTPIYNGEFVKRVTEGFEPGNKYARCKAMVLGHMHEYQESTGKLMMAIEKGDREAIFLLLFDHIHILFKILSFLNGEPYVTLSKFPRQSVSFKIKPGGYTGLLQIAIDGKYQDLEKLKCAMVRVYDNMEKMLWKMGLEPYSDDLETICRCG